HTRLQGDWSSDVCSSDLLAGAGARPAGAAHAERLSEPVAEPLPAASGVGERAGAGGFSARHLDAPSGGGAGTDSRGSLFGADGRSEERRVGKEWRAVV